MGSKQREEIITCVPFDLQTNANKSDKEFRGSSLLISSYLIGQLSVSYPYREVALSQWYMYIVHKAMSPAGVLQNLLFFFSIGQWHEIVSDISQTWENLQRNGHKDSKKM